MLKKSFRQLFFVGIISVCGIASAFSEQLELVVYGLHEGEIHVVDDGGVLFSGDSFQLEVTPKSDIYVYTFLRDSSGETSLLNPEVSGASFLKRQNQLTKLPGNDHWYRLDDNDGTETIVIVGSKKPQSLQKLEEYMNSGQLETLPNDSVAVVVSHIRHLDRDLVTRGTNALETAGTETSTPKIINVDHILSKANQHIDNTSPSGNILKNLMTKSTKEELENAFVTRGVKEVHLFKKASPAVVLVLTKDGIGSGSLLTASGLILTNWHVVGDHNNVQVAFMPSKRGKLSKDNLLDATVIKRDEVSDLALLKLEKRPSREITPLKLGSTDDLEIGADVHAIGHPEGEFWTYTKGYVRQLRPDYEWSESEDGEKHRVDLVIQTQTPINPGNSGGPLLDNDGVIVGVNSFVLSSAEGINYAISVEDVNTFISRTGDRKAKKQKSKEELLSEKLGLNVVKVETKDMGDDGTEELVVSIDNDKNGVVDTVIIHKNPEDMIIILDGDEDGHWDEMIMDSNGNGEPDLHLFDTDADGKEDILGYDDDEDGEIDRFEKV